MTFTKEQIDTQAEFVKVLNYQMEKSYNEYYEAEIHNAKCVEAWQREDKFLKMMRERAA